jgi:hypothetical protein
MHVLRWFFIALPFVGLAWVLFEAILRGRQAQAFARISGLPLEAEKPGPAHSLRAGLELHG